MQKAPRKNNLPAVWPKVISDMKKCCSDEKVKPMVLRDMRNRHKLGVKRYGVALQPFNGRDCLLDAYEEVLDLSVYYRQCLIEEAIRDQGRIGAYRQILVLVIFLRQCILERDGYKRSRKNDGRKKGHKEAQAKARGKK